MRAIVLFLGIVGICSAVDIESSTEGQCLSPAPKTVTFNVLEFMSKSPVLFTPLVSKYAAIRSAEDMMGKDKLKSISEGDIKSSCMVFAGNDTFTSVRGFNGLEALYELNPESKNSLVWRSLGSKEWSTQSWITKAGEEYFVAVDCWSPGLKSFAVSSVKKTLNSEDKAEILEHVKSLGFKSENIYELNYDKCPY